MTDIPRTPAEVPSRAPRVFDRHLWLALLLGAAVLLPRAALIARAHSECYDDEYHLVRGARLLIGGLAGMAQTDPPFGEALTALPLVLTNTRPGWTGGLYDHSLRPETTLLLVALWRSLLFLPAIGVGFHWCRRLYGKRSAWLAVALLLVDPTLAAQIPLASLDALGVVGVIVGCFAAWRWFETGTPGHLAAAAFLAAVALSLKHTAVILPLVALGYAVLWWGIRPRLASRERPRGGLGSRARAVVLALLIFAGSLWALTLFDVSRPDVPPELGQSGGALAQLLVRPLPGGLYLGSVLHGQWHAERGHPAYLLGEKSFHGWWYYFPLVALYKVPIGILVVLLLGLLSLKRARPRFEEWGLFLPLCAWTALMLGTSINIGFRHFLPAYAFMLLVSARCLSVVGVASPRAAWPLAAWTAVAAAGLHVLSCHPDYIAYINFPRTKPYLAISDSNVDWGQGLKQVRDWIDRHPEPGRPIYLLYFGDDNSPMRVRYYLGDRVILLPRRAPLPAEGLLIASPVWVAGPFDRAGLYTGLRDRTPVDVIGRSMLVYELGGPGGG